MKTKLKTDSKFIVNSENKVVVCKMKVDMQLHDSKIWDWINYNWWKTKSPMVNYAGVFEVTAIAKYNPNDTFDENIGKRIAESRCKIKAFKIAKNVWSCIAKRITEYVDEANTITKNCAAMEVFETKHKEKLLA